MGGTGAEIPTVAFKRVVRSDGAAVVSAGTTFEGRKLIPDAHPDVAAEVAEDEEKFVDRASVRFYVAEEYPRD